ncbi:hypothetical protein [Mesorhizobium sp. Cs1321R2N1]|uniref:hypothetical protein n=1 Tax=Mesorhizobium sp. Cs1321R2N1 TaxID=3015174 RepID=UPI00301C23C7
MNDLRDAAHTAAEKYPAHLMADPDTDAQEIPAKLEAFVETELMPIADKAVELVEGHIAPLGATSTDMAVAGQTGGGRVTIETANEGCNRWVLIQGFFCRG